MILQGVLALRAPFKMDKNKLQGHNLGLSFAVLVIRLHLLPNSRTTTCFSWTLLSSSFRLRYKLQGFNVRCLIVQSAMCRSRQYIVKSQKMLRVCLEWCVEWPCQQSQQVLGLEEFGSNEMVHTRQDTLHIPRHSHCSIQW